MICPSCGLDNPPEAAYCDDCGAVLAAPPTSDEPAPRSELRASGAMVRERYRIDRAEARGVCNAYDAVHLDTGISVRLLEEADPLSLDAGLADEATEPLPDDHSHLALLWRALHGVESPHLWAAHAFLYADGHAVLEGPPLPDETLQSYLAAAPALEAEELRALGLSLLDAVGTLHERGFLHLGVHPGNVRIDSEGQVVLDGYERLTAADVVPECCSVVEGYSAPEAYGIGGSLCPASDLFSVGVTLYYAVCRQVPAQVSREQFFRFPPLSACTPDVPREFERVVMKALSKNLAARYATASEMQADLQQACLDRTAPGDAVVGAAEEDVNGAVTDGSSTSPGNVAPAAGCLLPASTATGVPDREATGLSRFQPYRVGMVSDVGRVRQVNQDSMLVMAVSAWERSVAANAMLAIVADGMGGEAEGDKASSLAIRAMARHVVHDQMPLVTGADTAKLRQPEPSARLEELLREAMAEANRTIYEYSLKDVRRRGMGSTLTAVMIDWPYAVFGHAGDTRAYLLRRVGVPPAAPVEAASVTADAAPMPATPLQVAPAGSLPANGSPGGGAPASSRLDQVTEDHSLVGKLVRLGQLTRDEARHSPQRSYLYRAMGTGPQLEADTYVRRLEPGDRLLLCCDGVWEYFTDDEIIAFLDASDDPQKTCRDLVDEVLRRGADDNCTAIVIHVPEAGR